MRTLLAIVLLLACGASPAQSGRAELRGYVNFEGVAYLDVQPRASVRLVRDGKFPAHYETTTDEHGFYQFKVPVMGRCRLEISAKGYRPYAAELYLPSDFVANWAVELQRK